MENGTNEKKKPHEKKNKFWVVQVITSFSLFSKFKYINYCMLI